ncbi:putative transport protein particle (TRAPP) component [Helianthus annuus]|uniref:Transport protein particle (TRAPP) component n=1 Tax=Helianthus annuus TaxID=4232 RepID=A0A9K3E288_HELAN|nr:putative transport protein particle (TRAPP) component [Helianthus annuus]KAJ0452166.1 putative transport protein particle (TRAPP) component [Helianthus annuus]KAJ0474072.1 putative transport protein particle (TRAPP) component [Helianthus annuus]KAJ0649636.1 putative transport protein particle (TRAPP) component [Helianthus annuus]KAJ0653424.1 putative transport protein particle (TRAPP) component [Helianthus annuus]
MFDTLEIKLNRIDTVTSKWVDIATCTVLHDYSSNYTQGNRRETRLLNILSFIHSTVWKVLFGKIADSLEKGTEHEDEYMISEKELLVNRFISVPKDMGSFNCGAFVAGIVRGVLDNAGFPAVVTCHFVPVDDQQRPRTTILIKFAEEVRYYIICPFV